MEIYFRRQTIFTKKRILHMYSNFGQQHGESSLAFFGRAARAQLGGGTNAHIGSCNQQSVGFSRLS